MPKETYLNKKIKEKNLLNFSFRNETMKAKINDDYSIKNMNAVS